MEIKRSRGRQPLPKSEKKIPIIIWVKNKYLLSARKDVDKIQLKYDALT